MARASSQGADPSTGNKQRAPTQEPALVKVKRVLPWCPGLFLSCLVVPGLSWFRVAWSPALSLCFLACSGRGRRVLAPGWEGRRVSFLFLFC